MDEKKLRIMLKRRKIKLGKALRPTDSQPLENLLELWKRQAECTKQNADRLARCGDYEAAAQSSWFATVFGWCAEDLERSLSLYKFETYWKSELRMEADSKKGRKTSDSAQPPFVTIPSQPLKKFKKS
jgi:hypothetical protein